MKRKNVTCKQTLKHVCDNLDGDLQSGKCREIQRHLESCESCRSYLDSLKKTVLLYRAYPVPKGPCLSKAKLRALVKGKS